MTRRHFTLALTSSVFALGCEGLRSHLASATGVLQATVTGSINMHVDPPLEQVDFRLRNTSQASVACRPETWKLVVDAKELPDSDMIFGNGAAPVGGYGSLEAGESFEFGKGFDFARFFPQDRDYSLYWRGAYFQSNTITIRGSSTNAGR